MHRSAFQGHWCCQVGNLYELSAVLAWGPKHMPGSHGHLGEDLDGASSG